MTVRAVEGKKPYTGGKGIEIDENKVISLRLRDENNLIIWDRGDNEIYVDLQLPDEITPTDAFPVGVTTGRVIVDNGWDWQGTIVCFKTTSGDSIKLLYADDGKLYIDNGTGTFKQIYLKGEVDALLQALRDYVDQQLALKQDKIIAGDNIEIAQDGKTISAILPPLNRFLSLWDCSTGMPISFPTAPLPFEYEAGDHFLVETVDPTTNYRPSGTEYDGTASQTVETAEVAVGDVYIYDGTTWLLQVNHDKNVSFSNIAGQPSDNQALAQALNSKQDTLTAGTGIDISNQNAISVDGNVVLEYSDLIRPVALNSSSIYAGVYADPSTQQYSTVEIDGKRIGIGIEEPSRDTHRIQMEYYNGATDLYISDTTTGVRKTAEYTSSGITATTTGESDEVYEFKGGGNNQIARLKNIPSYSAGTGINIDANNNISNTLPGAIKSSTAPSNPSQGDQWYDTTNDQLKVYDGTNWNVTGKEYHAGEGIEIGTYNDYSAMQGPCPKGFHVPLYTEWRDLCDILTNTFGLSSSWNTAKTYLKLPPAGKRSRTDSNITEQNSAGDYWASTASGTDSGKIFYFNSLNFLPTSATSKCMGCSIRPFKDVCVIPDNTWTTLYDGSGIAPGAGIFHNSTLGLISISGDGTNRITIADKNVGATTVYNSGDAVSEANCGKYYQWGNNYGFPRTGSITTSSTQVDASTYGPGNCYNSSTFIVRSSSPYAWDSSNNGNLRGGVTGVVTLDNAITNTGVLSVNGQTGAVTLNDVKVSATAPSSPTEGMVWYDTTNDELKIYDGSAWNAVGGAGGGDVGVSTQANNVFTPGMKIWGGTSANYGNLTPDGNTAYLII